MLKAPYKMAASSKDKRTPITTPPYEVPSVVVTPDPPTFSLDTTFNSTNVQCNDLVSQRLSDKKIKVVKIYRNVYCHVLKNIGGLMRGKLLRSNSVLVCMRFRIHCYVTESSKLLYYYGLKMNKNCLGPGLAQSFKFLL
jgi:hypothetical protein